MSILPAVPTLADPTPRDLRGWADPSARKVRTSADALLNRAVILTRTRRDWEAGTLTDEGRARLARALVVYLRDEARAAAELFASGQLTERQWRDRLAEITGAGAVATTFALQGHRRINRDDAEELRSAIEGQFRYLTRFVNQVAVGAVPIDGRIVGRSLLYATSAWSAAQAAARSRAARTWTQERSVLGPADHCPGCLQAAAMGWRPIGTITPIGERDCRVNCRCRWEFRGRRPAEGPALGPVALPPGVVLATRNADAPAADAPRPSLLSRLLSPFRRLFGRQ